MLTVAGDAFIARTSIKAVLVDAEFTTRLGLRSLKHLPLPFVGRFRTDAKIMFEAQTLNVRDLAERFPPGKARWYPKLKRYVKRPEVPTLLFTLKYLANERWSRRSFTPQPSHVFHPTPSPHQTTACPSGS